MNSSDGWNDEREIHYLPQGRRSADQYSLVGNRFADSVGRPVVDALMEYLGVILLVLFFIYLGSFKRRNKNG